MRSNVISSQIWKRRESQSFATWFCNIKQGLCQKKSAQEGKRLQPSFRTLRSLIRTLFQHTTESPLRSFRLSRLQKECLYTNRLHHEDCFLCTRRNEQKHSEGMPDQKKKKKFLKFKFRTLTFMTSIIKGLINDFLKF